MEEKCKYCENKVRCKNVCESCYRKIRRRSKRGLIPHPETIIEKKIKKCISCDSIALAKGMCRRCYIRNWYSNKKNTGTFKKIEKTIIPTKKCQKGAGCLRKDGYRVLKINERRLLEHTYVMEQYLGRRLIKGESIHHRNGVRNDNRIENLELWSSNHCSGQRVQDKIQWCKEFLKLYENM